LDAISQNYNFPPPTFNPRRLCIVSERHLGLLKLSWSADKSYVNMSYKLVQFWGDVWRETRPSFTLFRPRWSNKLF